MDFAQFAECLEKDVRRAGGVPFVGVNGELCVFPSRIVTPLLERRLKRFSAPLKRLLINRVRRGV